MISHTLNESRELLREMATGANRRLCYPACGTDLGCSVGLFWHLCDSFYLVDPVVSVSAFENAVAQMALGSAPYMEGFKVESDGGTALRLDGQPARRYQVWAAGKPMEKKRLCFVQCGTNDWLDAGGTRYNVFINKDYAGFDDSPDSDFPYLKAWDRLNSSGIYAETLGDARSSAETECLTYQCRGFKPLWRVTSETGLQVGFAEGLHLLQKVTHFHDTQYDLLDKSFGTASKAINELLGETIGEDAGSLENHKEEKYRELAKIMKSSGVTSWGAFQKSPGLIEWLAKWLKKEHPAAVHEIKRLNPAKETQWLAKFIAAMLRTLRLQTWGSF